MNLRLLWYTLVRFPVALVMAGFATGLSIHQIHSHSSDLTGWNDPNWVVLCLLALPTSLLGKLWSESRLLNRNLGNVFSWVAAAFVLFLGTYWMRMGLERGVFIARVLHLALVVHLAIAVLPALRLTSHGFWEYNRFAFTRFVTITIFAAVLFLGLTASLGSVNYLFKLNVKKEFFFDIFFLCAFFYHPVAFLSKLPQLTYFDTLPKTEPEKARPTDTLCKFVALPLLALYFTILYLYLIRIIFIWELPRGGLGYLVSGVGLTGILCFLLLDPAVRHSAKLRGYRTVFFVLLSPMLVLLFVGMTVRVGDYGWTENRYLLAVFGGWLTLITVYFFASRSRDIRFVPITLAIVSFLTLIGPWSAYELPPYLQRKSLEGILTRLEILKEGKITTSGRVVPNEDRKTINELTLYLAKTPQRKEILKWSKEPLPDNSSPSRVEEALLAQMQIPQYVPESESFYHYYLERSAGLIPIAGYKYAALTYSLPSSFQFKYDKTTVELRENGKLVSRFDFTNEILKSEKRGGKELDSPIVVTGTGPRRAMLRLISVGGQREKADYVISNMSGILLLGD